MYILFLAINTHVPDLQPHSIRLGIYTIVGTAPKRLHIYISDIMMEPKEADKLVLGMGIC